MAGRVVTLADLLEPFPSSMVGKLPKGGVTLDYVGHGAVTRRLLDVDPEWNWEPLAFDEHGLPRFTLDAQGNPIALWIKLTVGGVTRLGVGTCGPKQFDAEKVLIGDALRNAAMRFGVALDLWIKGHGEDDERHSLAGAGAGADRAVTWTAGMVKARLIELLESKDEAIKAWEFGSGDSLTAFSAVTAERLAAVWLARNPEGEAGDSSVHDALLSAGQGAAVGTPASPEEPS